MPRRSAATIGAVVLAPSGNRKKAILDVDLAVDDSRYDLISIPAGGSTWLFAPGTVAEDFLMMMRDGRAASGECPNVRHRCRQHRH
ncbi:hypothetical protein ACXHXG_19350 [Rhizobium sp. LEGMi198b]|uniref:hypothetical protein n=1 Tax=Rhizobium sp. CB3090 TaxID=3039156 RepID=UPI0024B0C2DA|nr:hypothetical protein [Rhizobium sp. CB3090]WFU13144.1 hypothetical protein QA646_27835 [Rhizobium sp. CB3090]